MLIKEKLNFDYFSSFLLLILLTIRSSNIRELIPNYFFYLTIIIINIYIIFKQKPILSKWTIYFYSICFISLFINFLLGLVNPILDSWLRLFVFIFVFNIVGPFYVNRYSIYFR